MGSPWIAAAAVCTSGVLLAGCPASKVCTAGASVSCNCGDNEVGTQTCASDGSSFGACFSCKVPKGTSTGSAGGGSSGTGSSASSTGGGTTSGGSTSGGSSGGSSSGGSTGGSSSGATASGPLETVGLVGVIAAGSAHNCALVSGGVECWGSNTNGQLGNNAPKTDSPVPVWVLGLGPGSGAQTLVAGYEHSCAVVNGGLQCWGYNLFGQLGNGLSLDSAVPIAVQGLGSPGSGVQALAAGQYHTCALVNGGVQCWGYNLQGQLGNNSNLDSHVAVAVQGLGLGVQAIVAGINHTCALVSGGVQCWGSNSSGQLGNGTNTDSPVPVAVQGLGSPGSGVQALAAGVGQTCALVNGGVWCWGDNSFGALGDNSNGDSYTPVPVQGLSDPGSGVQALSGGYSATCALVNGGLQCWGGDSSGQLGNNSTTNSSVPVAPSGLTGGVQAVAAGYDHACALVGGAVQCWGANSHGQLGDPAVNGSLVPVPVQGLTGGVQGLALGGDRSCAVVNGGVQCWGDNNYGQLGSNGPPLSSYPATVQGLGNGVEALSVGDNHACALVGGGVQCWGDNAMGQLGNGSDAGTTVPVAVQGLGAPDSGVQAVAAGGSFTCAIVGGGVQCWGDNASGDLGNGGDGGSDVPVPVQGLGSPGSGVQALAAGRAHACALVNGGLQCWGDNSGGDLGNNSVAPSNVPVTVQGLGQGSGVQAVAAGEGATCALVNGALLCWGYDVDGVLGDNSGSMSSPVPVAVQGLGSGVEAVAAGRAHNCALVSGAVWCWGDANYGQLGDNDVNNSFVPVPVAGWAP